MQADSSRRCCPPVPVAGLRSCAPGVEFALRRWYRKLIIPPRADSNGHRRPARPWWKRLALALGLGALSLSAGLAQPRWRGWGGGFDSSGPLVQTEGGEVVNEDTVRTARETAPHSVDFPAWTNAPEFAQDVFTFARVIFHSRPDRPSWLGWINDYPDGDLNLSYRLRQLTAFEVNPDGRVLKLTDPTLADYPFIFMSHPESMELSDLELRALRDYLRNGGALLADDMWGARNWAGFESEMKRVLPGRTWVELSIGHPIFHCVFDLRPPLNSLQVPTIHIWRRNYDPANPGFSAFRGPGAQGMHVRAWLDDKQRIMVVAIANSDTGDGWEREGEDETYFREFSETRAYPLAINILFYLMTH